MVKGENNAMRPLSFLLVVTALVAASCHKAGSSPSIPGQWKWVESDWTVGVGSGKAYPGPDTTILLQFLPDHGYEVLLNGQILSPNSYVLQYGADSLLTFNGQLLSSSPAEFGLAGRYIYSPSTTSDTITLVSDGPLYSPAGAFTTMKFVDLFNPF
jgi:hypothetical protein